MNNEYVLTNVEDEGLAIRTVVAEESSSATGLDVLTTTSDGKLAIRTVVAEGGGDQHNLGYFATQAALEEAYPTATAGDYAIVGSTDTVWIWDEDSSEWVDSDQKGQVTSVNNQTGDVTLTASDVGALPDNTHIPADPVQADWDEADSNALDYIKNKPTIPAAQVNSDWNANSGIAQILNKPTIPDVVQYSTMPMASADNLGKIVQFTGTTDANYTNGYFYKCVSDGQNPATYSWENIEVQEVDALPSQTGQSGKFLTTDGTDASWSDKPLVNVATNADSLIIGGPGTSNGQATGCGIGAFCGWAGTAIGTNARAIGNGSSGSVAVGNNARATDLANSNLKYATAIGSTATAENNCAMALGGGAKATGTGSIQINASETTNTNSDANTFKVANANGNYEIMSADGTVPTARLTKVNTTITLTAAGWSSNTQTVNVTGMTAAGVVFPCPIPADQADYTAAGIICSAQAAGTLTFTCDTVPSGDIDVTVVMM